MAAAALVSTLVYATGLLISFAFIVVWIVVLVAVVRKHRPDVLVLLGASVGVSALATFFSLVVTIGMRVVPYGGGDTYMLMYGATSAASTLLHAVASALLIAGVAKLAKPPPNAYAMRDPGRYE